MKARKCKSQAILSSRSTKKVRVKVMYHYNTDETATQVRSHRSKFSNPIYRFFTLLRKSYCFDFGHLAFWNYDVIIITDFC